MDTDGATIRWKWTPDHLYSKKTRNWFNGLLLRSKTAFAYQQKYCPIHTFTSSINSQKKMHFSSVSFNDDRNNFLISLLSLEDIICVLNDAFVLLLLKVSVCTGILGCNKGVLRAGWFSSHAVMYMVLVGQTQIEDPQITVSKIPWQTLEKQNEVSRCAKIFQS